MEAKLTLKLDKDSIEQAKIYAKERDLSLSKMVEKYFISLTDKNIKNRKQTKLVKELSGIINSKELDNYKEKYADFLMDKYK